MYQQALQLYRQFKQRNWLKNEALEQANFVLWLEKEGYTFSEIPNATYSKSYKQNMLNIVLGLRKGLPDLMIKLKQKRLIFIEMKKAPGSRGGMNGSRLSAEQEWWINELNDCDCVGAIVAQGCDEAIEIVEQAEKDISEEKAKKDLQSTKKDI